MNTTKIAQLAYEVNRAFCAATGDHYFGPWDEAPDWQKDTLINGVQFHLENPDANPEDSHVNWMAVKEAEGWVWGPVKDSVDKTHPCMVPYEELPRDQRVKDHLFIAVVHAADDL